MLFIGGVKCHVWHGRSSLLSLVYLFAGLLFLVDVFTYIKNLIYIFCWEKSKHIHNRLCLLGTALLSRMEKPLLTSTAHQICSRTQI